MRAPSLCSPSRSLSALYQALLIASAGLAWIAPASGQGTKSNEIKWDQMDLGPFHSGTFRVEKQITAKGIAFKVGDEEAGTTMLFDTELLRWSAGWTGGFITFPRARGGLEGQITPAGKVFFSTGYSPGIAAAGEIGEDPRERHLGNLGEGAGRWKGLALHGKQVELQYAIADVQISEIPWMGKVGEQPVFCRTLQVGPCKKPISILAGELGGGNGTAEGAIASITEQGPVDPEQTHMLVAGAKELPAGAKMRITTGGRAVLDLPPSIKPIQVTLVLWSGMKSQAPASGDLLSTAAKDWNWAALQKTPAEKGIVVETQGALGKEESAYAIDEIALPDENPAHSWLRPGGHDFLPDGRLVLASISGDVWLASGLDGGLQHIHWQRFATGLFQPLGVKVVKSRIYVLGRDQITQLVDTNQDGTADRYENFNNDCQVTENYHEFALDLQTDSKGNFYYAKGSPWEPNVSTEHQGTLLKVSPDGAKLEVVATGLRAPNGLNVGPRDEITVSDNQGHWMPENRLNIIKPGGFYGMVPAAHRKLTFETKEGTFTADPSSLKDQAEYKIKFWGSTQTPIPKEGYDLPLCWMPKDIDNSSGGEVWVPEDKRWGPLAGHMLQMSYGKCALFDVLGETVAGVAQASLARFPVKFSSGIMRGRFNPADGQLYLSGLKVWQSDAAKDGCLYRVRYTGGTFYEPVAMRTTNKSVELSFATPLDAATATDPQNFSVEEWNYLWSGTYGSAALSIREPGKKGRDTLNVSGATLSPDGRKLTLAIEDLQPAMQFHLKYKLKSADGHDLDRELFGTLHRLAPLATAAR